MLRVLSGWCCSLRSETRGGNGSATAAGRGLVALGGGGGYARCVLSLARLRLDSLE
jgi:hypothetical protein